MSSTTDQRTPSLERVLAACAAWNLDEVHHALEQGFIVDSFDDDHVTALQTAAANGNIGIVEYLLDNGADIEKSNQVGMTALHHASRNGHTNVVRILVQRGANYQKLTYYGASPMTLAAAGGHTELVKFLLDLRVSVNPLHTALCPTPIIAATFRKHTHICALLTHRGAYLDGHVQRLWNLSTLSTAIACGATSVVGALLELGANPSFRSLGGRTAVELAAALHKDDILDLLNNALTSAPREEKHPAVDLRDLILRKEEVALRQALQRPVPYVTLPEGTTPLMYAVLLADINIVRAINECGGDVCAAETLAGLTALMMAAIIGDSEMVEYLLNAGADISQRSFEGFTALDYAFALGSIDAETLCLMQRQLDYGSPLPTRTDIHQQFSRAIQTGKAKFLSKISNHVAFGASVAATEPKETAVNEREHLKKLLLTHISHKRSEFVVANDILRSIGHGRQEKQIDTLHSCIRTVRHLAELASSQGSSPVMIALCSEESQLECSSSKYSNSIDPSISSRSQPSERQKEYFSLAQRNADIFYEYRFPKCDPRRSLSTAKNRLLFDEEGKRKNSTSTSASGSEEKSPPRARNYSSLERTSSNALGTTPRIRVRSRETVTRDDDERSSPSRLSLNQYIFALRDDRRSLKKSTSSPILETLMRSASASFAHKKDGSRREAFDATASANNTQHHGKRHRITEDTIWSQMYDAGLGTYVELLKMEEFDKTTFITLTDEDLTDLGISSHVDRKKILKIAQNIRSA